MQFNLENDGGLTLIDRYTADSVTIRGETYCESVIVFPDRLIDNWQVRSLDALSVAALQPVIEARPEVILLGTGATQQFPDVTLLRELARHQVSIDVMDNGAGCRTYNVLASEFRAVALALILG